MRSFRRALLVFGTCGGLALAGSQAILAAPGAAAVTAAAADNSTISCATPDAGQVSCGALVSADSLPVAHLAGGTAPSGLAPADLQRAYSLPSAAAGAGQTVAVVTAFDDPSAEADLGTYRSQFSLPACTTANGCFHKTDQAGGTSYPGTGPAGWSLADAQALDMISAACPSCRIDLVEANSTAITDLGPAENEAVALGAKFVTNTWFTPEATFATQEPSLDTSYFSHPGVAITAPDGNGAGFGTFYPAASPDVVAVGGTTLTADNSARGFSETAWEGAGSGCSPYEAKPSWQADSGCTTRTLNDISAVADPSGSPIAFFDASSGGWVTGGGDNAAAALIAASFALAGTPATDSTPASYLYANAAGLGDVTAGSNGTCSPSPSYLCTAGTGYDGPTGLGTPDGVSSFLASYYKPITPVRLLDTRSGTGGTTGPVAANTAITLTVDGAGGIPSANVTAVAIDISAVPPSAPNGGFISAYADGTPRPITSNVNFAAGTNTAGLAIVPVGADGKIDLYNANASDQLLADAYGYFTSDAGASGITTYTPVTPDRILDTRSGLGAPKAQLPAGGSLALQVTGVDGVPAGVSAVAINLTAADSTTNNFLTAWADGASRPTTSIVQFGTNPVASLAIVPVGADGKIDIGSGAGSPGVDVIGDIAGYFAPGTSGEAYRASAPTRLLDTRNGGGPVASGAVKAVSAGSVVVAPSPTLVLNVTAVGPSTGGSMIAYPAGTPQPSTSTLNYVAGQNIANLVLGATGSVDLFNDSSGTTQIIADVTGYLATA